MTRPAAVLMMVAAALWQPATAHAQRTQLTVTGFPVTFAAPTGADFETGEIVSAAAITFTVNAQTGVTTQRTTTVSMRCAAPCPTTGTKSMGQLYWRRADLTTWNAMSTTDAVIESRPVFRNQPLPASNDPWSNSIFFKFTLDWLSDPPSATQNSYNIIITLTVTVP